MGRSKKKGNGGKLIYSFGRTLRYPLPVMEKEHFSGKHLIKGGQKAFVFLWVLCLNTNRKKLGDFATEGFLNSVKKQRVKKYIGLFRQKNVV